MKPEKKNKVLILCTGNSCRSQLAEALVGHDLSETWQAYSAGTEPTGTVHPKALTVLQELGIVWDGRSKHVDSLKEIPFDVVITVCDSAAENCPLWLGEGQKVHLGFPDPAQAVGSDEAVTAVFRQVRDDIRQQIIPYLAHFQTEK